MDKVSAAPGIFIRPVHLTLYLRTTQFPHPFLSAPADVASFNSSTYVAISLFTGNKAYYTYQLRSI